MKYLNSAQIEQLKEIGAHLQQKRQELSKSIEEVAAETLIRLPLLKALEEGQTDLLPEPVFIQGFIRRYGDVLGMDGNALAKAFPINFFPTESDNSSQGLSSPSKFRFFYLPSILLAVAAISGVLYFFNRPKTTEPIVQEQSPPIIQQQKTVATEPLVSTTPKPTLAKPVASPSVPIQVSVKLKEQSWLRVIVDGKTQFEGILTQGKQQTWTAKQQLILRAGNAGGVMLSFNGEEPKILGERGNIREINFTPEN